MTDDKIILLRKHGLISLCSVKDVAELTRKSSDVLYVLIDVGMYTNEYIMIPREKFLRKFKYAELHYKCHIEVYTDGITHYADPRPGEMICRNVLEFYRAVHSIQKLYAAHAIMHCDYDSTCFEEKLTNVDLYLEIGKRVQHICIETMVDSSTMYDIKYVLETLNYMAYENASIQIIPYKDENPKCITVDILNLSWKLGCTQSLVMPTYHDFFRCWSFIPSEDYDILSSMTNANVTQYVYIPIRQTMMPRDTEIDGSSIYDLDGNFIEVLTERDLAFWKNDIPSIIEFIINARYIFLCSYAEIQACYGDMSEDLLLVMSYSFIKSIGPKYSFVPSFQFSINRSLIDSNESIYRAFMKELSSNYARYIKGGCEENE